jgi:hypothetical protein
MTTAALLALALACAQTADITADVDIALYHGALKLRGDPTRSTSARAALTMAAERFVGDRELFGDSPGLGRTIGHAYYLAGDLPRAILAYRRGLSLDPANEKLQTALAYARGRVEYPPSPALADLMRPERELWPAWLSLQYLGLYAFIAYTAVCLAVTRWRMTRRRGWLMLAAVAAAVALVPAVGSGVGWWRQRRDEARPVVVVARPQVLHAGNGADYPPRLEAPLPRGAEVRRLFERGGWLQVELSGGVVGWVPHQAVVVDE